MEAMEHEEDGHELSTAYHPDDDGTEKPFVATPATERLIGVTAAHTRPYSYSQPVATAQTERFSIKTLPFAGLILTTGLAFALLLSEALQLTVTGPIYEKVLVNRASVQIAIQIVSGVLGYIQINATTRLINYATRIRLRSSSVSMDGLGFWSGLSGPKMSWVLPWRLKIPLLIFVLACYVPAALWTGALTPVTTQVVKTRSIDVPSYHGQEAMSDIYEWPPGADAQGPTVWVIKGLFTYSVGIKLQDYLLASAASGTTVDGGVRRHSKLDGSAYEYIGRSYGVGASPGLVDDLITVPTSQVAGYTYRESGYTAMPTCIYNSSSDFALEETQDKWLYAARGNLPDTNGAGEYSTYFGMDDRAIVAIGVTQNAIGKAPAYMAFAAGANYSMLDQIQCHLDFTPSSFTINVSVTDKTIRVVRNGEAPDVDPSRNLVRVAMRQYGYISNDQTNFYTSIVGDSLNSSINNMHTSLESRGLLASMTEQQITLAGVQNSTTAMMDDMLVAYGSAQLMIGHHVAPTAVKVTVLALKFGERLYIILTFVLNSIVLVLLFIEMARTKGWRRLIKWDYTNASDLVLGGWRGGEAKLASQGSRAEFDYAQGTDKRYGAPTSLRTTGRTRVRMSSQTPVALSLQDDQHTRDFSRTFDD